MEIFSSTRDFQKYLHSKRTSDNRIGFVPTMGALHDGHTSLIDTSVKQQKITAVSIFINPLQFAPDEDFEKYPKSFEEDVEICKGHGVDALFSPTQKDIFPYGLPEPMEIGPIGKIFEGKSRPSHFQGVATVVSRLFEIVGEVSAYFGEKDFQQLVVVDDLVKRHQFPVKVIHCPTVRDDNGLALSSRNVYLSGEQLIDASVLYNALCAGADLISNGEKESENLIDFIKGVVADKSEGELDYVGIVDSETFNPLNSLDFSGKHVRILIACCFGSTRLIDNIGVVVP